MKVPQFIENGAKTFAKWTFDNFSNDTGKLLLYTGTLGWILSSLAQITAIVINKKIPDEQKKFLIPQEIGDAVVNIGSFILITERFTQLGKYLTRTGKILSPSVKKLIKDEAIISKIGKKDFNFNELPQIKNETNLDLCESYGSFSNGMGFIFSTIGSIFSCNIVTPLLRNKFASQRQKAAISQDKMQDENLKPTIPVLPMQNRFTIDDYKARTMNRSSGSLRI